MAESALILDKITEDKVRRYVPPVDTLKSMAEFFSGLSDSTRIKILSALSISSMCVSDISTVLGINQTTVSHQLKNLKSIGVVDYTRQGKVIFYYIKDERIFDILLSAVNMLDECNAL